MVFVKLRAASKQLIYYEYDEASMGSSKGQTSLVKKGQFQV
jgi:hypothetical protein